MKNYWKFKKKHPNWPKEKDFNLWVIQKSTHLLLLWRITVFIRQYYSKSSYIFIKATSSPGKLRFVWKCIRGEWLYNIPKGVGCVYSVSKRSVGCSKVCENDCQHGVKPLSAIICLMKRDALKLPILCPNILQC